MGNDRKLSAGLPTEITRLIHYDINSTDDWKKLFVGLPKDTRKREKKRKVDVTGDAKKDFYLALLDTSFLSLIRSCSKLEGKKCVKKERLLDETARMM